MIQGLPRGTTKRDFLRSVAAAAATTLFGIGCQRPAPPRPPGLIPANGPFDRLREPKLSHTHLTSTNFSDLTKGLPLTRIHTGPYTKSTQGEEFLWSTPGTNGSFYGVTILTRMNPDDTTTAQVEIFKSELTNKQLQERRNGSSTESIPVVMKSEGFNIFLLEGGNWTPRAISRSSERVHFIDPMKIANILKTSGIEKVSHQGSLNVLKDLFRNCNKLKDLHG